MGIFSRFRDIVSSNINAMLEKAEDPEKLIKLMIHEMEETLVEIKASCAGAMANSTKVARAQARAQENVDKWEGKARLAMEKGREELARDALLEKRRFAEEAGARTNEVLYFDSIIGKYREDIALLEDKL